MILNFVAMACSLMSSYNMAFTVAQRSYRINKLQHQQLNSFGCIAFYNSMQSCEIVQFIGKFLRSFKRPVMLSCLHFFTLKIRNF